LNKTFSVEETIMQNLDDQPASVLPITSDPETLSGQTVFRGTRVPVAALLDNIEAGLTLDEFLENFPTVTREQAIQVLEFAKDTLSRLGHAA
jgi:uncharacterized protein (DUF433 family)